MLLLALLLALPARASRFAETPAQMTASVRGYFGPEAAAPADMASTLAALEGVDPQDPGNSLALENLADATQDAAQRVLESAEKALTPRSAPPSEQEIQLTLERLHVLQRSPLSRFLTETQRQELARYEHEYVTLAEKDTAILVEKRLAELSEALTQRQASPAPAEGGAAAEVARFFSSPVPDATTARATFAAVAAAADGPQRAAIDEQVRAGADKVTRDMRDSLENGADSESAKNTTVRLQALFFSPLSLFPTNAQRAALRDMLERFSGRFPDGTEAGLRIWYEARMPNAPASPAAPRAEGKRTGAASAGATAAARRVERALVRHQRESRRASRRPAVEKPVTTPDWLRGPAPLSPAMKQAHALADALAAARNQSERLAAARALAAFARARPNDEDLQRHAARALVEALGRAEDDGAVDELLARLAASSQFGRIQEIAAAALTDRASAQPLAAVGLATKLPHVRALVAKSGVAAASVPARLEVEVLLDAAETASALRRDADAATAVRRAAKAALGADEAVRAMARARMLEALRPALQSWERSAYYDALTGSIVALEGGPRAESADLLEARRILKAARAQAPTPEPPALAELLEPVMRRVKSAAAEAGLRWKILRDPNL